MRVAEIMASASRRNGGVFYALRSLLPRVLATGAEVRVFAAQDSATDADRAGWGAVAVEADPPWPPAAFGYTPRLMSRVDAFRPTLVHTHGLWTYPAAVALRASRSHSLPFIVSPQGMLDPWALRLSRVKKRLVGVLFQDRQLRDATVMHALTKAEARDFRAYGLRNPIAVIPNPVEPVTVSPTHKPADGTRRLLFLGRIHPKKGLDLLIDALAQLTGQGGTTSGWRLDIAGWDDGGHRAALEDQVGRLGLRDRIAFLGPVFGAEKEALLSNCDAFVLTSHSEGLPVAVLEAWAHRKPVLISRPCNLPEAEAFGAGIVVDPTQASIETGLRQLLTLTPGVANALGEAGLRLASTRFSSDRIAADYVRLYQAVLERKPLPEDLRYEG